MYKYSKTSQERLNTCHPDLQDVFREAIKHMDIAILEGYRNEADQNAAHLAGKSKLKYPESKHNFIPSLAIDAAPFPIDWNNRERFNLMAGLVIGIAAERGIKVRWGGDWDMDGETTDNRFDDLVHFELVDV